MLKILINSDNRGKKLRNLQFYVIYGQNPKYINKIQINFLPSPYTSSEDPSLDICFFAFLAFVDLTITTFLPGAKPSNKRKFSIEF